MQERFAGLVLRHRGRTGLTQRELAARLGVHMRSVQDWEAGVNYPGAERLQALIGAFFAARGFTAEHEAGEAEELWAAALRDAPRMRTPFDQVWFSRLLAESATPSERGAALEASRMPATTPLEGTASERWQDWGEAPDVLGFVGRTEELATLRNWVLKERCRLVAVLGMGGIGKTTLAAKLAQELTPAFQRVYWRSLRNAPTADEWLGGAIGFLSGQQLVPPQGETARIALLVQLLRDRPSLLVLDNLETLLAPGEREGLYRDGYAGYSSVLQAVGEGRHQSCLVLTSREAPAQLGLLGSGAAVRALELGGLGLPEGQALLADKQLSGDQADWANLIGQLAGNGLALKIVGETIRQVFGGGLRAFLEQAGSVTVVGGIRRLIAEQIERTPALGRQVLTLLAIEREPMTLMELVADLGPRVRRGMVVESIEGLRRRSLVDRAETAGALTLQSVVLECVTDRLVDDVCDEIVRGEPLHLLAQPLIKAQAIDYVRRSQERLIGQPILQQLCATIGTSGAERRLLGLIEVWRDAEPTVQGYGPGNVANLLRLLRGDLNGVDLSGLRLRQVYFQEVTARDASLAGAELENAILADAFGQPNALAMSADGRYLAAATSPGRTRVWRVADRTPILSSEETGALSVALSGDGQLLASAGPGDASVRLWEVSTGRLLSNLQGQGGGIWQVALSHDGKRIATCTQSGAVEVWDVPGRSQIGTLYSDSATRAVALSADGATVAGGGGDGSVTLWDVASRQLLTTLRGSGARLIGVAVSANGGRAAAQGVDGQIQVWDASSPEPIITLGGHAGLAWHVALSADGNLIASVGQDGVARLWDVSEGQLLVTLRGQFGALSRVVLSGDGQLLASAGADGSIRVWEGASGRLLATLQGQTGGPRCVAISRDGRIVASGNVDGTVNVWEAATGRVLMAVLGHSDTVYGVALSDDGRRLVSCSPDGSVKLWEATHGELLATLQGSISGMFSVALSGDGQLVAGGCGDGSVRLWEASTGHLLSSLQRLHLGVLSVALTADRKLVAGGGGDGTVGLWEVSSGQLLATIPGPAAVRGVALGDDGDLLAIGSEDGIVRLWRGSDRRVSTTLPAHAGTAAGVGVSEDGHLLATGGADGLVKLWDAPGERLIATLHGHSATIWGLAASRDGVVLASASADGTVKIWDTNAEVCLRTLRTERRYERMDITGLKGVTDAQRQALLALGAVDHQA